MIRAQPRPIGVVLQYRVGTTGGWTTVGDTVYDHSSADRTDGDLDHFTAMRLPTAANGQDTVQLRWASWRGTSSGYSSGIAIDNISISGQAVELRYFRTAQSGAWGDTAIWEVSTDSSSWNSASAAPSYLDHTIYIRLSHTVSLYSSDTIDQVVIDGSLIFSDTASQTPIIHNGPGTELLVNGTFEDNGSTSIIWETDATWAMGASATLVRTRSTSSNNWRDHYQGGIDQIPSTAEWTLRKVGSDSPTLSTTDGMHYPNLSLENYSGSVWETGFQSSFTGFLSSPVIKGNLNVGGPSDDGVSFLNSNTHPNPVLVKGNLKVKDESTLRNHGRGFEIWGDPTFEGSYDADTGMAMIVLSGVADQQVFSLSPLQVAGLRVNKPSGKVKLSGNNVLISDTLALENGIVEVSASSTITVMDDAFVSTATNASHIEGKVKKIGNDAFTFPVGRNGVYRPIGMSAPSNVGDAFAAEYFESNSDWAYSHQLKENTIGDISRKEFWNLERTTGTSNVTITLGWDTLTSCPIDTLNNLQVVVWTDTIWRDLGNGGTTGDSDSGTIQTNGASTYYGIVSLASKDSFSCAEPYLGCGPKFTVSDTITESYPLYPTLADHFGNKYTLEGVSIDSTAREGGSQRDVSLCTAGYFKLYFQAGSGMEDISNPAHNARRDAVCAVYQDVSDFITSPLSAGEYVNVLIRDLDDIINTDPNNPDPPASSGVLGAASPYYVLPPPNANISGIIDNQVWTTINSGTDAYTNVTSPLIPSGQSGSFYHSFMGLNFANQAFSWNVETTLGSTSPPFRDLYTVVLHEVLHSLGFASLINENGDSKLGPLFPYYTRYDMFLQTQTGQSLLSNTASCSLYDFGFNVAASDIAPDPGNCTPDHTNCVDAIEYSGSIDQLVYTSNCFDLGSSLSHFEDECQVPVGFSPGAPASNNLYFVMSNAQGNGLSGEKRYPKPEERLVLCDLGYKVVDEYGGSAFTTSTESYIGGDCPGLQVAGINDGLSGSSYAYSGLATSVIPITNILDNDFGTDQFTCLEVIYPSPTAGSVNFNSGTAATNLTYTPSTQGIHVLRYIPKNSTSGNEGNITYIYVYAINPNCTPSACIDLVNNGGFENASSGCGNLPPETVECWSHYSGSPNLYGYFCTGIPI